MWARMFIIMVILTILAPQACELMDAVVSVFCGAGVLFLLFAIPRMVDVLPASVGGLLRAKELLNFENTMSLSRERDTLALLLLPLFVVALACYRVIPARLIIGAQPLSALGWTALFALPQPLPAPAGPQE